MFRVKSIFLVIFSVTVFTGSEAISNATIYQFCNTIHKEPGICRTIADCSIYGENIGKQNFYSYCTQNSTINEICCPFTLKNPKIRSSEKACKIYSLPAKTIVRGERTKPREFPYMYALGWLSRKSNGSIEYKCGGVSISTRYVLTAAHCFYDSEELPVVVRPGGVNLTDTTVKDRQIVNITEHPDYDFPSSYNDIALVELEKAIDLNFEVPACIWTNDELKHNEVTVIGYGDIKFAGLSSDQLLKANLLAVSNKDCERFYEPEPENLSKGIINTQLCVSDPEKLRDSCQGDSGGPVIMKVSHSNYHISYVVGITSFGRGCAAGPPGVYTRVSKYVEWIESIVWPYSEFQNFSRYL